MTSLDSPVSVTRSAIRMPVFARMSALTTPPDAASQGPDAYRVNGRAGNADQSADEVRQLIDERCELVDDKDQSWQGRETERSAAS